jgi:hypothetical protein
MSSPERLTASADSLAAQLEQGLQSDDLALLTPEALQRLMAALCRTYVARVEAGEQLLPVAARTGISDTAAMMIASGMLRANNLQIFELGMWQSWAGT